jgi:hypothetical protein
MLPNIVLSSYLQIGVFSSSNGAPFKYDADSPEYLRGTDRPVLWQLLAGINRNESEARG